MRTPSKEQTLAIEHINGPALLIAGPGSGKTFTITKRLVHLISDIGIKPENILVVTFSKAAALEMQNRYTAVSDSYGVNFGTFHSLAYNILKSSFKLPNSMLLTAVEKRNMLTIVLKNHGYHSLCTYNNLTDILDQISKSKNSNNYHQLCVHIDNQALSDTELSKIINEYQLFINDNGKIDFDDMILKCLHNLREYPDKLREYQNKFKYIMVDEFQDINTPQYDLITLLAQPSNNLFVVGDDDQSIYRFRGSTFGIMKQFKVDFPTSKTLMLMDNYRSGENIVYLSKSVIERNHDRITKDFHPINKGGYVHYKNTATRKLEEEYIVSLLAAMNDKDIENTAIIVRTNMEVALYSSLIKENNFKLYTTKANSKTIYDSFVFEDILSFLQFIYEGNKRESFIKFMNKPNKYIQRISLSEEIVTEEAVLAYYSNNYEMQANIKSFFSKLHLAKKYKPQLAIALYRKTIGYDKYVKEVSKNDEEYKSAQDALGKIEKLFAGYHFNESLREFAYAGKDSIPQEASFTPTPGIHIITMHTAKGLEFENVILPDVNEGVIPSKHSCGEELEEERRLLYVAITRAKSNLYILTTNERNRTISRFIKGIVSENN